MYLLFHHTPKELCRIAIMVTVEAIWAWWTHCCVQETSLIWWFEASEDEYTTVADQEMNMVSDITPVDLLNTTVVYKRVSISTYCTILVSLHKL